MDYEQLKEEKFKVMAQQYNLQERLDKINKQLKSYDKYTFEFLDFNMNTIKENTPYLYELLLKIKNIDNDCRTLEWGRGKNPVDYSGIEFTYNKERYTTGYAHNSFTGEYLYIEYERADREYCKITNLVVKELNDFWTCEEYDKFEEYLKINSDNELEQIALLIFVSQNLIQW